jgi:radical SAM/Cys-rich protein
MNGQPTKPNATAVGADDERTALPLQFSSLLASKGLDLVRGRAMILQINMGLRCNEMCRHCHLEAGPDRDEMMDDKTAAEIVDFARRGHFQVVDITGGAPELNSNLAPMIESLAGLAPRIMLRSNLTALTDGTRESLMELCKRHKVVLVASFPSLNKGQADSQRGKGNWQKSIAALKQLNAMGYGEAGSGLELDLVSNPVGAFLSATQEQTEKKFRQDLKARWGIVFNHLYAFSNVPLGRFRKWLIRSGNYEAYMGRLAERFNPSTLPGLIVPYAGFRIVGRVPP